MTVDPSFLPAPGQGWERRTPDAALPWLQDAEPAPVPVPDRDPFEVMQHALVSDDRRELLKLALTVAREAGELLRVGRDAPEFAVDTKSSPTDVVTAMDRASEKLVTERLLGARPDDGFLGEEGTERDSSSGFRWVVDPLDGTVNYLYRLPFWAVSIGVEQVQPDNSVATVAGVVHAPVLGWTFAAELGGGSWLFRPGTAPLRLIGSTCTELGLTMLGTGFSYSSGTRAKQGAAIAQLLPQVRDIRRHGSGALDLCMAAWGVVDAYLEKGLNPWDLSAGALVAREAGLVVEGLHGAPESFELVVAAMPALFPLVHDAWVAAGGDGV